MKKILGIISVMLLVLVGCSSSSDDTTSEKPTNVEDMVTVNWTTVGTEPADLQQVQDAMNEILAEDYGVQLDFTYIGYADYTEQVGLQLASGEPMDIIFAPSWALDFMTNVNDGLYYPLNDLIDEDFKNTIDPAFWDGVTVDDNIYAVPTDKELAPGMFALFNEEILNEQGYDISKVNNLESALKVAQQYHEDTGDVGTYIDKGWLGAYKYFNYDCVPQLEYQVCLDVNNTDAGYQWLYNIPEYKDATVKLNALVNDGTIKTNPTDLYAWSDITYFMHTSEGIPTSTASWETQDGVKLETPAISDPVVTTDTVRGSLNVIAAASEHPEEAFTVIKAINTDERLRNLYAYGIEGTHYNLTDDGKVELTDAAANYTTSPYAQGDYDTMYLLADEPDDARDQIKAYNDSAIVSPALGFTPDLSDYNAQVANILNINQKYAAQLYNFTYTGDVDDMLAPIIEEYKSVGAEDVIKEINTQYEQWQSENK